MARLISHPSLFIIDMQNGFCHPNGTFSKIGMPTSRLLDVVPAISRLRALCHAHDIPVFYTAGSLNADYSDAGIQIDDYPAVRDLKGFVRGTWDAQILDDLQPASNETVIAKTRNSAFWGTRLDAILRERGIDQLIVAGVATNVCVESTVRDAWTYGFRAVTVSDATGALTHEEQMASMTNLRHFGGSISIEELERELQA